MTTRKDITRNSPFVGWFQYSRRFNGYKITKFNLPSANPYVGTFRHTTCFQPKQNVSATEYSYNIPIESLLLYFKTFTQPPTTMRSVACQTDPDDVFIVL